MLRKIWISTFAIIGKVVITPSGDIHLKLDKKETRLLDTIEDRIKANFKEIKKLTGTKLKLPVSYYDMGVSRKELKESFRYLNSYRLENCILKITFRARDDKNRREVAFKPSEIREGFFDVKATIDGIGANHVLPIKIDSFSINNFDLVPLFCENANKFLYMELMTQVLISDGNHDDEDYE